MLSDEKDYFGAYDLLVQDPTDLKQLMSYIVYKQSKISYIEKFRKDHGRDPCKSDFKKRFTFDETQISHYKDLGEAMFNSLKQDIQIVVVKEPSLRQSFLISLSATIAWSFFCTLIVVLYRYDVIAVLTTFFKLLFNIQ